MTLDAFLTRLDGVKRNGRGATALCPGHEDQASSLSVGRGDDGRILVKCFAGCAVEAIAEALGLELRDLFPDREPAASSGNGRRPASGVTVAALARAKGLDADFLRDRFGLADLPDGRGVMIPYRDADGEIVAAKLRIALVAKAGSRWPKGKPLIAYVDAPSLTRARASGRLVLVEGESDTWTLAAHGLPVLGLPGATTASTLLAAHLDGVRELYVCADADEAGTRCVAGVRARLAALGYTGRALVIEMPDGCKDVNDLYRRDPERFVAAFQAAAKAARPIEATGASAPDDEAVKKTPTPLVVPASSLTAPEITYRVRELGADGMLHILSGRDKLGKTLLAQQLARSVVKGEPLFGRFDTRQGKVIAAFLDDPLGVTLGRLDTLGIREHPNLYLVDPLRFVDDPFTFLDHLEAEATTLTPGLIIVDALYLLSPNSTDAGNDAARMKPIMQRLDRVATMTQAMTLLVAHDNKSGMDVAGSYVVRAMAKVIFRLTLPRAPAGAEEDDEPATSRRLLKLESKLVAKAVHALDLGGPGRWTYLGDPKAARATDVQSLVGEYLDDGGCGTLSEITDRLNRRREDVRAALVGLVEATRATVEKVKGEGRGRPREVYRGVFRSRDGGNANGREHNWERNSWAQPADNAEDSPPDEFRSPSLFPKETEREHNSPMAAPSAPRRAARASAPAPDAGTGEEDADL